MFIFNSRTLRSWTRFKYEFFLGFDTLFFPLPIFSTLSTSNLVGKPIYGDGMKPPPGFKKVTQDQPTVEGQKPVTISAPPPAGFKKVSSTDKVGGLFTKEQLATKMIPQFTKGLYEGLQPVSGAITSRLPNAKLTAEIQAGTPAPKGLLPFLARIAGEIAPAAPFEAGAGALLPKAGKLATSALGWGAYRGTQEALKGKNADDVAKTAVGNAAGAYVGGKAVGIVGKGVMKGGKGMYKGGSDLVKRMTGRLSESELGKYVQGSIEKAVRPSVVGKNSATQLEGYHKRAKEAVDLIVQNKDVLNIKNEYGEITGKLPQSLDEFGQAIDQVKTKIFSEYNAMAERTGAAGIHIDVSSIADDIEQQVNNKAVKTFFPEIVEHALEMAKKLREDGIFTPQEVQTAVEMLNSTLKAYYRNPNPQAASKVVLDVALTTKLRQALDKAISNLTGESYQSLKNAYGALRTIQDDVVKRAIVDARKNQKGFFDLTDVFSTGDIAQGLLTLNPGQIAKGASMRAAKEWIKGLNNPNRMVKEMFQVVDKVRSRAVKVPVKPKIKQLGVDSSYGTGFTRKPSPPTQLARRQPSEVASTREFIPTIDAIEPKLLEAPVKVTGPKLLGVTNQFGPGFERVPPEEAFRRIKDWAFRYYNPQKKMIEIPEGTVMGTKAKGILKKMGIDPITGKMKYGKPSTAFEVAWKRATKGAAVGGVVAGTNAQKAEASAVSPEDMTKQFEGFKEKIYYINKVPHVGYGFNLQAHPEIKVGKNGMTREEADKIFTRLYSKATKVAVDFVGQKEFDKLTENRKTVLKDMAYNLEKKLNKFTDFKNALLKKDYKAAAAEMKDSLWYKQVKSRADKNIKLMREG